MACAHLDCEPETLCGRGRAPDVVRMRELIGLVGIERYGVKVTELAAELGKSRGGISHWCRGGTIRRAEDVDFAAAADALIPWFVYFEELLGKNTLRPPTGMK